MCQTISSSFVVLSLGMYLLVSELKCPTERSSNINVTLNSGNGVSPLMYVTRTNNEWEPVRKSKSLGYYTFVSVKNIYKKSCRKQSNNINLVMKQISKKCTQVL